MLSLLPGKAADSCLASAGAALQDALRDALGFEVISLPLRPLPCPHMYTLLHISEETRARTRNMTVVLGPACSSTVFINQAACSSSHSLSDTDICTHMPAAERR